MSEDVEPDPPNSPQRESASRRGVVLLAGGQNGAERLRSVPGRGSQRPGAEPRLAAGHLGTGDGFNGEHWADVATFFGHWLFQDASGSLQIDNKSPWTGVHLEGRTPPDSEQMKGRRFTPQMRCSSTD